MSVLGILTGIIFWSWLLMKVWLKIDEYQNGFAKKENNPWPYLQ